MNNIKSAAAAVLLIFALILAVPVSGEVLPPEEGRYTGPCMGDKAFSRTWLDRTHAYITAMFCQPAVWFDGFFGSTRAGEDWPGSLIRWQGSYRWDEREEETVYRSEFRASFRLPRMTKKMKLVVTSESSDDPTAIHPDEDPYDLEVPSDIGTEGDRQTTAGLRYYLTDSRRTRINIGTGVRLGDPVQPYVRLRLRHTLPLSSSSLLRLTPSVIWLKEEGINRSLHLDVDSRTSENILLRASQSFVRKEVNPGILWGTTLTLFDRLTANTVLALEAAARGNSFPANHVERYRLSTRLRSNFLRDWLFLELEPEYYWPRDALGEYHLFRAITFRLEIQFYS